MGQNENKKKAERRKEAARGMYSPSGSKRFQLKRKQGVWWTGGVFVVVVCWIVYTEHPTPPPSPPSPSLPHSLLSVAAGG